MSDVPEQLERSTRVIPQEQARRRKAVDAARHSSEMEGARSDEPTRTDQEAYVRGELTVDDLLKRVRHRQDLHRGG